MGAGARLSMGLRDVLRARQGRAPGDAEAGAGARLPVGFSDRCAYAAGDGHLEILQWAREHDCPWDEYTGTHAAASGHLEVLKWARERDCPWDEETCEYAADNGELEVLRWAIEHGAPGGERYAHLLKIK